jgi:phage terminase large subunit GpA-like protein
MNQRFCEIFQVLEEIARPPPNRAAWQWADHNRILPVGSAEPGEWRSARVPWTIPITEFARDPQYQMIVVIMGSQCAKTETLFNLIGWKLDDDPMPMLYIGPTRKNVESISKNRIMRMLESTPSLWKKLEKGKRNTITEKYINGVRVGFGWAGSATELASHPAAMVFVDERSRMGDTNEGDPVSLAQARIATYPNGKIFVTSTPTEGLLTEKRQDNGLNHWEYSNEVTCPTWSLFQQGTAHEWAVPCPECGEYFVPRSNLLHFDQSQSYSKIRKNAFLACPNCGAAINDHQKSKMNAAGKFITKTQHIDKFGNITGEIESNSMVSFWISGLCSPWVSWGERAEEYAKALKSNNPGRIMAVINTAFGELFGIKGESTTKEMVAQLKADYELNHVPTDVTGLTCGVDVQGDRLVYAIRGWAAEMRSYLITNGELRGDTSQKEVWERLDDLLNASFDGHKITGMAVDSGFNTTQVYKFARTHAANVYATKGRNTMDNPFTSTRLDVMVNGRTVRNGLQLFKINTDYYKSWLIAKYKTFNDWNLPSNVDDDYLSQISAEERLRNKNGEVLWKASRPNHYFDCEVLNVFLCELLKIHLRKIATPSKPVEKQTKNAWIRDVGDKWI